MVLYGFSSYMVIFYMVLVVYTPDTYTLCWHSHGMAWDGSIHRRPRRAKSFWTKDGNSPMRRVGCLVTLMGFYHLK